MTTPTYTSPTASSPAVTAPTAEAPATSAWHDRTEAWLARLRATPRLIQAGLDVAGLLLIVAAFTSQLFSPEIWFHWVFVVLVLHGFLFGLRGTLVRIGIVSVPLLVYANADALGLSLQQMELTEWPLMFVIAVLVAWMADRAEGTSRRYAALFRRASERLLTVQEDERRRVARELHDGVGQVLTALTLTLDAEPEPMSGETRRTARQLAGTALAETRDLAERLRPARLDEIGLVHALRDLAHRAGFPVDIEADLDVTDPDLLSPSVRAETYRIVQEALANAARHSGADGARVTVGRGAHELLITVTDEGVGFDPADPNHVGIGLAGMAERAELIGAGLTIESRLGHGARVSLRIPIASGEAGR